MMFEQLNKLEAEDRNFRFGATSGGGMFISYAGYKHMELYRVDELLRKEYRLKYDFSRQFDHYDQVAGRTYIYYKNVYTFGPEEE